MAKSKLFYTFALPNTKRKPMKKLKVREVIKLLEKDGWYRVKANNGDTDSSSTPQRVAR